MAMDPCDLAFTCMCWCIMHRPRVTHRVCCCSSDTPVLFPPTMSSPRPSGSRPPSFPLGPNDIAAQMGQMRIGVTPPRVSMPEPRVWTPPAAPQDEKPLPPVPQGPPLPPRVRPNHVVDRPNPYDFMPPIPIPPPMMMPAPTHYEDERPVYISHSRSDPPPAIRPSPVPPISVTPPGTAFQQHAPHNRPRISLPPQRYSSPPSPTLDTLAPPQASAGRVRASSVPPSPSTSRAYDGGVQCSGTTKTGKRCTRVVKAPHPYTQATPAKDGDIEVCPFRLDIETILMMDCPALFAAFLSSAHKFSSGAIRDLLPQQEECLDRIRWYSDPAALDVLRLILHLTDWIPSYLSPDTRAALRAEMSSSPSAADVSGYIYCYEIRDQKTPNQVHLKVGRAVNMVKRLDEWSKQCGSKEVVLRGWWPGKVVDNDGVGPSLLKGRVQAGEKGKYCHRLERK